MGLDVGSMKSGGTAVRLFLSRNSCTGKGAMLGYFPVHFDTHLLYMLQHISVRGGGYYTTGHEIPES